MSKVYIYKRYELFYPDHPPFHPSELYPEYKFTSISKNENLIYDSLRNLFYIMGFDKKNWNTEDWNPFKEAIKPGDCVLIKPNLVKDVPNLQNCITTHPSIIRAIIDYVIIALKGRGKIIIGDAPLQKCNFKALIKNTGLEKTVDFYKSKGIDISLCDFRTEALITKKSILFSKLTQNNKKIAIKKLSGDPKGYSVVNLKKNSNLHYLSRNNQYEKFRVTDYDHTLMKSIHNSKNHKYLISNSVIQSDVIISLPKIKAHRKAGITACLKNCLGINGHKDWLPHHRRGSIFEGGDEYLLPNKLKDMYIKICEFNDNLLVKIPYLYRALFYPLFFIKAIIYGFLKILDTNTDFEGSWYGNDTLWRTIADLNQILLYIKKDGILSDIKQRKRLFFCDGVISGENDGPLDPTPKNTGLIIGGSDPLMIDLVIAEIFNLDYKKIPQLFKLFKLKSLRITDHQVSDLKIISNYLNWNDKKIDEIEDTINFKPSPGWKCHIEKYIKK